MGVILLTTFTNLFSCNWRIIDCTFGTNSSDIKTEKIVPGFDSNIIEIWIKSPINITSSLVHIMALHQTDDKPLSGAIMDQFDDGYMHFPASID